MWPSVPLVNRIIDGMVLCARAFTSVSMGGGVGCVRACVRPVVRVCVRVICACVSVSVSVCVCVWGGGCCCCYCLFVKQQ